MLGKEKNELVTLLGANVPYAYAIGNHDDQGDYNRTQMVELDQQNALSYTQMSANLPGVANYVVSIYTPDGSKIAVNLFIFSTTDTNCYGIKGWGCVEFATIEWYKQVSAQFTKQNGGTPIPAFAFFHIPMPEFMNVWNFRNCTGIRDEEVCCFSVNTGLYAAFKDMGDVQGVYCGHDHNNDYLGLYNGIQLAYGMLAITIMSKVENLVTEDMAHQKAGNMAQEFCNSNWMKRIASLPV